MPNVAADAGRGSLFGGLGFSHGRRRSAASGRASRSWVQTQANVRALAERVYQLGGTPNLDPEVLHTRSFTSYQALPSADVVGMVRENLLAARIMVQTLQEAIRWVGDADPTTRRLLEGVLEDEEREASELRLLADGRSA